MSGGWLALAAVAAAAAILALAARRFTEMRDAPTWSPAPLPPPRDAGREDASAPPYGDDGSDDPGDPDREEPFRIEGGRVPVTHPVLRQAAEQALARGGEMARSFSRDGELIYATFAGIADPMEREAAVDILMRMQSGEEVGMDEVVWLLRRLR